jgi:hypothetical protein
VELDRINTSKTGIQSHQTGLDLELSGEKEERWAKKHREEGQYYKNYESEDDLERCREGCPKPSEMEKCHRWPMLHPGRRAKVSK